MSKVVPGLLIPVLLGLLVACGGGDDGGAPPPPSPSPMGTWTSLAPMPQPRTEHNVVAHGDKVYVAAGIFDGTAPTELFIYDPASDSWSQGAPLPAGRHHAALAAHDGALYLTGGYPDVAGAWVPIDAMFIYDIGSDIWTAGPTMPEPRGAHAVAVTDGGRLHVVGGITTGHGLSAQHMVFDIASGTWSMAEPMPAPREHLGATYHNGRIYVAAGRTDDGNVNVFSAYDVAADTWTTLAPVPTARSGIAVTTFEGRVYVFGGEEIVGSGRVFEAGERYDPAANAWEAVRPMPTARHGLGAGVVGSAIYVIGGGPQAGLFYSSVNERWTP